MTKSAPTILIIEDDVSLLGLYQDSFAEENYKVITATTADAGLHQAASQRPDIIILDIMLPGGQNGFDVLESLKRDPDLKSIPVLVLTNLDNQREIALSIGAAECFVKANVPLSQITAQVKKHLPR